MPPFGQPPTPTNRVRMQDTRVLETDAAEVMAIDEAEIDRALADRRIRVAFPPALEALYEAETARSRSRSLARAGLLGMLVYAPFLAMDWLLVPDVFDLAVIIRFGVLVLALVVYMVLLRSPPRMLREGISGAICVVAGYSQLLIMTLSASPDRDRLHYAVALIVVFVAVVQRLHLSYAVLTVLMLLIGHTVAVVLLPDFSPRATLALFMVSFGLVGLCLFGSWSLSHEVRHSYLVDLKRRRANLALAEASFQDPLTALENRRALDAVVLDLISQPERERLAAILVDLDHFKQYNDTQGHAAGDMALRRVAELLKSSLRGKSDHAFRFGGEEFLLLLPRTHLEQAAALAERLRKSVEGEAIPHPAAPVGILTASFGVAAMEPDGADAVARLIESADVALYEAKRAGRNCIFASPASVAPETAANESAASGGSAPA